MRDQIRERKFRGGKLKTTHAPPPAGLGTHGREFWAATLAAFEIDDVVGLRLLATACEALDRLQEARALIKRDGACIRDRFGQVQRHPAVAIERDAGRTMVQALRGLNLDAVPPPPAKRWSR